jgi:hypothetical protein
VFIILAYIGPTSTREETTMHLNRIAQKAAAALGAALLAIVLVGCDAPSTGTGFVGKYKTSDTTGNPMEISLMDNGSASGSREGAALTGSWKDEGDSAVITWSTDWTTKLTKDGDKYSKTAFKGGTMEGDAVAAEKVE